MFEVTTRVEVQKSDIDVWITDCLNFYIIVILSLKQTEVYLVQEFNFSSCL